MDQARKLRELAARGTLLGASATQVLSEPAPVAPRARVLAVTSGKGGVGKTNISVGLGLVATALGRSTVLLDGDLGLANVDVILDIQARYDLSHVLSGEATIQQALTHAPGGLRVLPGAAGMTRMANLTGPEHQLLMRSLEGLERDSDLMIIDTGAGISRRVIEFCLASHEVLVVTTPEPTAITDAYAMIKVLGQADPTMGLWLLVNMAASRQEAEQVSERIVMLARRFLQLEVRRAGYVLHDVRVPHAVRRRTPFSLTYPHTPAALCLQEVARTLGLEQAREDAGASFFRRVTLLFKEHLRMPGGEIA